MSTMAITDNAIDEDSSGIASANRKIAALIAELASARHDEELLAGTFERTCKALGMDSADATIEDVERAICELRRSA